MSAVDRQDIAAFRAEFQTWMDENDALLEPFRTAAPSNVDEQVAYGRRMQRMLYDTGWIRRGWPEEVGGLGGTPLLRGVVSEELTTRGCPPPFTYGVLEVLGPAVVNFGSPELAGEFFPKLLDGTDTWCQGFSEPEAGSDLGSLRTRAVDEGDHWRVNGQKIWTSWASTAQRCILLVRTGTPEEGFKGITALFVDMDWPGIEVRPLKAMSGDEDFAELFLTDLRVPKERLLGQVGGGAAVTMAVLANERSVVAWQRQAWLHERLRDAVRDTGASAGDAARVGAVYAALYGLRLKVRDTFHTVAAGGDPGATTSIDKILLSTAEKAVFDAALDIDPDYSLLDDGAAAQLWRYDHAYSRASSIYGGTQEIQRNILAERVLALPRER